MSNKGSSSEDEYEIIKNDSEEAIVEDLEESGLELDTAVHEESIRKNQEEIKKRMHSLKKLISGLKELLSNEKKLWKQEIQEQMKIHNHYTTHELYCSNEYHFKYQNLTGEMISESAHFCYTSRSDDDLIASMKNELRYETSQNFNSEITIENYKRRLLEVESMCNIELDKLKQNVQSLQNLQDMAEGLASGDSLNSSNSPEEYEEINLEGEKASTSFEPSEKIEN